MKQSLALILVAFLACDILYTCAILQSSCRRIDRHKGHTEWVVAEMLGRLGAVESELAEIRARRLVVAEAGDGE